MHPPSSKSLLPLSLLPLSLHSSTLLLLSPLSPSSWHSDSTGEYAPSRSYPRLLAPTGGVSLETVSELTGWVQIDGCPLSDCTTRPLKAARENLCPQMHPCALRTNGPFRLTHVNISLTQAEGVFAFSFLCVYWISVFIAAYMQGVCVCVHVCD